MPSGAPAPSSPQHQAQTEPGDFRVRNARRKREVMRRRLLDATLAVCSAETMRNPAVIDDVIRAAGVSRGTFYKYFSSLDEAIAELGRVLMHELVDAVAKVRDDLADPRERVIIGPLLFIARAAQDPQWGAFVSSIDHLGTGRDEQTIQRAIAHDLREGQAQGVVEFASLEAAMDVLAGASRQAVRRIIGGGRRDARHILDFTVMNMMALGMARADARGATERLWRHLHAAHLDTVPWLRALDATAA